MYLTADEKSTTSRRVAVSKDIVQAVDKDTEEIGVWVREKLQFEPDAAQERILRTQSRRVVMNCTRQWGKSTVTAAKAIHQAYTVAGSLTLVVSPSARQTGEFMRKA